MKDIISYESFARQKFTGLKNKKDKPTAKPLVHPRNVAKPYHDLSSPSKGKDKDKDKDKDKKKTAPAPPAPASPEPKWLTPARGVKPSKKLLPSGPPRSTSPKTRNAATPAGRLARGLKNLVQGDTSPAVTTLKQIAGKRKQAKESGKDKNISQSSLNRFKEWKKGKGGRGK